MKFTKICLLALAVLAAAAQARAEQTEAPDTLYTDSGRFIVETAEDGPAAASPTQSMRRREMRKQRGLSNPNTLIVPNGQWVFGGTISYSTHSNDNYKLLVVESINSQGYSFKVSPFIGYAVLPNAVVGLRAGYSRSFTDIDNASVNLGSGDNALNLGVDYYYALQHNYDVAAIWRQYIPLGQNKRFGLFTEFQLAVGGAQRKFAEGSPLRGTYTRSFNISLGVNPGIVAFMTNNMAIEVNIGVLGLNYSHSRQVHNQVATGDTRASYMNFNINIFSIGLGAAFYL